MSLSVIAQVASAVTNVLFVVVIAVGYYMMIRLNRQMVAGRWSPSTIACSA